MKRLIMATMVTAILASSTVWAADNAPVAAQQQTQQVQQTQKTAAAERISEQGLYAMRDVQVARLALFHGDPEKAKEYRGSPLRLSPCSPLFTRGRHFSL